MTTPSTLLTRLASIVGRHHVLVEDQATAGYRVDWTGRFRGSCLAVVRPADTAEVAAVLAACHAAGQPVVPQGGNTGLVGGGVPRDGEVVLSLRRLDSLGPLDPHTPSVVVGAGVTLATAQRHAAGSGLSVGVDLAARDSATIGGMVATNAGGIRVVAHGSMREQVIGIEAVTADGAVLRRLPGLAKDNSGYDLAALLAGSEGTLAVITAVGLRLVRPPASTTTLLLGCEDVSDALVVLDQARRAGRLLAVELMRSRGLDLVAGHLGLDRPLADASTVVLVEWEGAIPSLAVEAVVGDRSGVVAQDAADRSRLWRLRESHTEAVSGAGVPVKLDVTVPLAQLTQVVAELDGLAPQAVVFGHLAEGNLHVNLLDEDREAEEAVLALVAGRGGAISSEHGIGVAKAQHLHLTRSAADLSVMRAIKAAVDPTGILNPGVILPGGP